MLSRILADEELFPILKDVYSKLDDNKSIQLYLRSLRRIEDKTLEARKKELQYCVHGKRNWLPWRSSGRIFPERASHFFPDGHCKLSGIWYTEERACPRQATDQNGGVDCFARGRTPLRVFLQPGM